ncbi:chloramphenicol acetyltransferase, partial [Bacteroides ovatus]
STGKYFRDGERLMMPVSVTCHHGLMDGYHVAQFIEKLHL